MQRRHVHAERTFSGRVEQRNGSRRAGSAMLDALIKVEINVA